ncbi:MAG: hypothetical protein IJY36_02845 [Coprobacter sp.]|nr:hypothetical protein [Coprobacter sp.]
MKRFILPLLLFTGVFTAVADDYTATEGKWQLNYSDADNSLTILYNDVAAFNNAYAKVVCNVWGSETDITITTGADLKPVIAMESITDELGDGRSHTFTYVKDSVKMVHRLNFYDEHPYMVAQVTVEHLGGKTMQSRHMIAMAIGSSSRPLKGAQNRFLWVPFDNDGFVCYGNAALKSDTTSHEVTAVFDADSRYGLVAGSIDHDSWKSGISVGGESGYKLTKFQCLSGFTNSFTRDVLPHGKVKGAIVKSARYMIGFFDDWREGMNTFAAANTKVAPRAVWTKGNPVGWSSWGVMADKVNYNGVMDCAAFLKDTLFQYGFHDREGRTSISLDAFATDNISQQNLYNMGTKYFSDGEYTVGLNKVPKQGSNQVLGLYCGPLVVWEWTLDGQVYGTGVGDVPAYTGRDIALRVNGDIYKMPSNGGLAVDGSHPGVAANIRAFMKQWASWGVKYIKSDFQNNGIVEGDSYYDPDVTTGVQAYNKAMKVLLECAEEYGMYVVLSISPIFPYQYAHGRRVSCDSWSSIGHSEYVMNAISYGWWMDSLYTVNDPDHLVMLGANNNMGETIGENRARATSGMVSGAYIFGDNFSDRTLSNGEIVGYPEEARRRAMQIMANRDVNDYVRNNTGSFMPVEGDDPSSSQQAESFFVRHTNQYTYFAVFNYTSTFAKTGTMTYERLGIDASIVGDIKELWLDEAVTSTATGLTYRVPAKDARVYRITRTDYSGVNEVEADDIAPMPRMTATIGADGCCVVTADTEIASVSVYSLSGVCVAQTIDVAGVIAELSIGANEGVYIVRCETAAGDMLVAKCVKQK